MCIRDSPRSPAPLLPCSSSPLLSHIDLPPPGQPPGDYLLFVHLVDAETGALVAQRDTHPGLGNFPSSQWRPGDRFVERLSLYVPETAYVPADAELRVGLSLIHI